MFVILFRCAFFELLNGNEGSVHVLRVRLGT